MSRKKKPVLIETPPENISQIIDIPFLDTPIPKFLMVKGIGVAKTLLNAFDLALLDAGIGDINLVKISSILPPGYVKDDYTYLVPGGIYNVAYSHIESENRGDRLVSAVAVGIPKDSSKAGVIMERSWCTKSQVQGIANYMSFMVHEAMAARNREIGDILYSIAEDRVVGSPVSTFAGLVLV